MLKKLFNDKKFLFIFSFLVELIFYYFFEYLFIGGDYIIAEIGIGPIMGLMFGPAGALGQALASLVFEIYEGYGIANALIDCGIIFFISIFTYKLWYALFNKKGITTPKFDSVYNLLKFIAIIFISSIVYWAYINISLNAYPPFSAIYPLTTDMNIISYNLNMFSFSLLFGLLFISIFNILKIPLQSPKKWPNIINVKHEYFILIFIILLIYPLLSLTQFTKNPLISNIIFAIYTIVAILACLNKLDVKVEIKNTNYSIIEKIILVFLIILAIVVYSLFDSLEYIIEIFLPQLDYDYITMITFAYGSGLVILLSIIHIYYIETIITNPIYELIDSLKEYKKNKMNEKSNLKLKKYLENDDDISRLVQSFILLKNNIEDNLSQIKTATAEKERIETEFNIASDIQSNMLKTDFKEFPKDKPFEIYGFMEPAREVGGDFYDYFQIDEENMGFVIGDVSGKGVPATLFMVETMYLIRNHSKFDENPHKTYENVNNLLCQRNDEGLFVTSWFGKINLKTGKLTFVNAGHEKPLIKKDNNTFEYLDFPPNFVLGGMEDIPYNESELYLNPGDTVFLYTDGITEANNNYQGFYGKERLKETINKYKDEDLDEILERIKTDIYGFCDNEDQFDDMTMLIIKYTGCEDNG